MKNVPMPHAEFIEFKEWLRQRDITWRDLSTAALVPAWNECVCDNQFMIGSDSCAQYAYKTIQSIYPGLSLKWRKEELQLLDAKTPFYFEGLYRGNVYHIDIVGAYSQFYRYLFWHSEWPFKRQRHSLYPLAEFWANGPQDANHKIARNSVIGVARSTRNKWVKGNSVWYTAKVNKLLSPTLWAQLQGILQQIASVMLEFGAIWINTDGYIFRHEWDYQTALEWFEREKINVRCSIGEGEINGIASMNVPGVKVTGENNPTGPINRIGQPPETNFLLNWNINRENHNNER